MRSKDRIWTTTITTFRHFERKMQYGVYVQRVFVFAYPRLYDNRNVGRWIIDQALFKFATDTDNWPKLWPIGNIVSYPRTFCFIVHCMHKICLLFLKFSSIIFIIALTWMVSSSSSGGGKLMQNRYNRDCNIQIYSEICHITM